MPEASAPGSPSLRSTRSVLDAWQRFDDSVRIQGSTESARSLALLDLARQSSAPWVVFCPDEKELASRVDDLRHLQKAWPEMADVKVLTLPHGDTSVYGTARARTHIRFERTATLCADWNEPTLVLTTLMGWNKKLPPVSDLRGDPLSVQLGESLEREELVEHLATRGYLRVDPCEDKGTFAIRGDIVEFFSPQLEHPIRVEFFGDEIERIRAFDPSSQRPIGESLEKTTILPAREVVLSTESRKKLRTALKAYADDHAVSRKARDPVLQDLDFGSYIDHSESMACWAFSATTGPSEYLPIETRFAWIDPHRCVQEWDEWWQEQLELAQLALKSDLLIPPPGQLYFELEDQLIEGKALRFEVFGLGAETETETETEVISDDYRVSTRQHWTSSRAGLLRGVLPGDPDRLAKQVTDWVKDGYDVTLFCGTQTESDRMQFFFQERAPEIESAIRLAPTSIGESLIWPEEKMVFLLLPELRGKKGGRQVKVAPSPAKDWSGLQDLAQVEVGDLLVHFEHGIGRYQGLKRMELLGAATDFIHVEYHDNDRLYVPVYRMNALQPYVGASEKVALDRLGGQTFSKSVEKAKKAIKKLAVDLVDLYARRALEKGRVLIPDSDEYSRFEERFPYVETDGQLDATASILSDLSNGNVMDRLVCGDVGFGKTEVAMRAAFASVAANSQVAVLVPTTILALQHEKTFKERFRGHAVRVESLSRFKTLKERKEILAACARGEVDILIGTHRILSRDVEFKDLGIIIVDEEHRFGVEHKEKLKRLKVNTHVLTLTATPIPRTLQMALSGVRQMTVMASPPVDRLPIRTFVARFDEEMIERAIRFELARGGQVFFLHNRVETIHDFAHRIQQIVPEAKIIVAHGQMKEADLERRMLDFYEKKANVLICTTIIESGLDIPSANTMIIHRADSFGLAQLYQLRGRVGRSGERAYAYLLIPPSGKISDDARKRLSVIQKYVELGSGFQIATHDLEIRGGGNLLGAQQSGHIAAIGYELYTELLDEAIREIQGRAGGGNDHFEPEIQSPFVAFIDETYVPNLRQRLSLYRRFSVAESFEEIDALEEEMRDRFGKIPDEAQNFIWLMELKQMLKRLRIPALTIGKAMAFRVQSDSKINVEQLVRLAKEDPPRYKLRPDGRFIVAEEATSIREATLKVEQFLANLTGQANDDSTVSNRKEDAKLRP